MWLRDSIPTDLKVRILIYDYSSKLEESEVLHNGPHVGLIFAFIKCVNNKRIC